MVKKKVYDRVCPRSKKAIFMQTLYMYFYTNLIDFHMRKYRKLLFFHGDFPWRCEAFSVEFWGDLYNDFLYFHLWNYWKYSYLSVSIFSKFSFNHSKNKCENLKMCKDDTIKNLNPWPQLIYRESLGIFILYHVHCT